MKTPTLSRITALLGVGFALLCVPATTFAAKKAASEVVPMGDNTFSITHRAGSAFTRDTDKLKADVQAEAAQYCAAQGKQLKVLELTADKPFFSTGYASAKIVFQALTAAEIEQAAAAAAAPASSSATYVSRPASTDDLYNDLMKLDDLRKKGILTDDEFQAEKKKVLSRSK